MKPIALLLTGGTIGSRVENGWAGVEVPAGTPAVLAHYRRTHPDTQAVFAVSAPLSVLSENMTPADWSRLLDGLRGLDFAAYSGILITHGTDTLAYTAQLLAILLADAPVPVLLVSSHTPPADETANGHRHFAAAVDWIERGGSPGIYAPLSDGGGEVRMIPADRLTQCAALTDRFGVAPARPARGGLSLLRRLPPLAGDVLLVQPYPGLDYRSVAFPPGVRAVLHSLYHSGTACAEGEHTGFQGFAARCAQAGIPLFVCPAREKDSAYRYLSAGALASALPLYGIPPERAYALLTLGCALYPDTDGLTAFMREMTA